MLVYGVLASLLFCSLSQKRKLRKKEGSDKKKERACLLSRVIPYSLLT